MADGILYKDLDAGLEFTVAPSGNGTLYTKISRWRASFIQKGETQYTTVINPCVLVYMKPTWRND